MKKVYLLAALAAIITVVILYFYLDSVAEKDIVEQRTVVIANVDVPANTKITNNMVSVVEMPTATVHNQAIQNREDVIGKVISSDLIAGEVILAPKVQDMGTSTDALAYLVEDGMRAITISVTSVTGVSGYLRQGDRVDIFATALVESSAKEDEDVPMCLAVAENIEVIAVGNTIADSPSGDSTVTEYTTVTFMADPVTAQTIAYAEQQAVIHLSLRSATDHDINNYKINYNLSKTAVWK